MGEVEVLDCGRGWFGNDSSSILPYLIVWRADIMEEIAWEWVTMVKENNGMVFNWFSLNGRMFPGKKKSNLREK